MTMMDKIKETVVFLQEQGVKEVDFGLILGSGLGELADEISNPVVIDYADIPNWGKSTVAGHAGKLVYGTLSGKKVLALQGRFHFYEGNPLDVVTFPVRVMAELDATGIVVTNAAGGVTHGPGTLMIILTLQVKTHSSVKTWMLMDHVSLICQVPMIKPIKRQRKLLLIV